MHFCDNVQATAQGVKGVKAHIVAEILCISLSSIVMADSSSSSVKKDACTIPPPLHSVSLSFVILVFKPRNHKKGVHIDGHERKEVVTQRIEYWKVMEELRNPTNHFCNALTKSPM